MRNNIVAIAKEVVIVLSFLLFIFFVFSFVGGLTYGFMNRCDYESIITKFNPSYVLGCELTRPRWRL